MKLITSRFEYYHTLYGCVIGRDYIHNGKQECRPFVPSGRAVIYFKINGKLLSVKQILDARFLVRIDPVEVMPF